MSLFPFRGVCLIKIRLLVVRAASGHCIVAARCCYLNHVFRSFSSWLSRRAFFVTVSVVGVARRRLHCANVLARN